jgi:HEAT repeat protein
VGRLGAALVLIASTLAAQDHGHRDPPPDVDDIESLIKALEEARIKHNKEITLAARQPDAVPRMIERIAKGNDTGFAAAVLIDIGKPAVPELIAALAHDSHAVRSALPRVLAKLGASAPVRAALAHENPRIRAGACRALGWIGRPDTHDDVAARLREDQDEEVRFWAAWATEKLGGHAPVSAYTPGLKSADPEAREVALKRMENSSQETLACLSGAAPEVQARLAEILLPHRDELLPKYEEMLASEDAAERRAAVVALALVLKAHGSGIVGREQRREKQRRRDLRSEVAIDKALAWLRANQEKEGHWNSYRFGGGQLYDAGVTGLALLAFLGAGIRDEDVRAGLEYLLRNQERDGVYGTRSTRFFLYNHALASLAMCEAASIHPLPRYRRSAQRAVDYILKGRAPDGGWGYDPGEGPGFTVLSAWMVLAVDAGRRAGLAAPEIDAKAFLGQRTKQYGKDWIIGYARQGDPSSRPEGMQDRFPAKHGRTNYAAGVLIHVLTGKRGLPSAAVPKLRDACLAIVPGWSPGDGRVDMPSWYFTALMAWALSPANGAKWHRALAPVVRDGQRSDGSWPAVGPWGDDGGRVYATAMMTLCLEAPYLYGSARKLPAAAKTAQKLLKRAAKDTDAAIAELAKAALAR